MRATLGPLAAGRVGRSASVLLALAAAVARASDRPALFVTDAMLARVQAHAASRAEPWASAWRLVKRRAEVGLRTEFPPYVAGNSVEFRRQGITAAGFARDCALVYHVTGDERHARKARQILVRWASHEPLPGSTLSKFPYRAGYRRGDSMAGLGLNVGILATAFCHAYSLAYPAMSADEHRAMETWLRFLAGEIQEGHHAWIEHNYYSRQAYNNHLSGHNMGLAAIGFVLRDQSLTDYALDSPENPRDFKEMINGAILMPGKPASQFAPGDRSHTAEPGEVYDRYRVATVRKGKGYGLGYSLVHLKMLAQTAEMAYHNGIDLHSYTGPHGENLKLAFEYYADFLITGDPAIKGGYYRNNMLPLGCVFIYETAHLRYPESHKIAEVLARCERVVQDAEVFGRAAVLTHGLPVAGQAGDKQE